LAEAGAAPAESGAEGREGAPEHALVVGPAPARPPAPPAGDVARLAGEGLAVFSTVAHELRGPLMALATSAELLVADFDSLASEQIREMVVGIHCRALWLQELVENLLFDSGRREGRLTMHLQPLNLLEVVAEVRQVVSPLLRRRAQRLRIMDSAPAGPLEVRADGRRLGQVLVNLILNASKFSAPGRPIDVVLSAPAGSLRVTVADRGPGVPEELAERLFEPYFRAPSIPVAPGSAGLGATAPEGVGLGLAIVKEIVARHGGRVGVGPRRGGGARFWFELPALVGPCAGPGPRRRG
jgi:signal transduction histidine kinase